MRLEEGRPQARFCLVGRALGMYFQAHPPPASGTLRVNIGTLREPAFLVANAAIGRFVRQAILAAGQHRGSTSGICTALRTLVAN